jgi:hypothetical protein
MSTFAEWRQDQTKVLTVAIAGMGVLLFWAAMALPKLNRSRIAANAPSEIARQRLLETEMASRRYYSPAAKAKPAMTVSDAATSPPAAGAAQAESSGEQKMIRTSSLELVVQHPAEAMDRITALAERVGGYLVSSEGGGQSAATGSLTIRVPVGRFEEVRAELRKLGLRVESEKIEAQDVTRQYVDQEANLRNLRAEESQYLAILKQANTVKDMLTVSEKLSEVRGQIEQQQAEFNALSKQTETVAITIALRTEAEEQVFGLNWRPLYQVKVALRDGLDSVANYASAMTTILFYLPAVVLWLGTILVGAVAGWRVVQWVGRRWFGLQRVRSVVDPA